MTFSPVNRGPYPHLDEAQSRSPDVEIMDPALLNVFQAWRSGVKSGHVEVEHLQRVSRLPQRSYFVPLGARPEPLPDTQEDQARELPVLSVIGQVLDAGRWLQPGCRHVVDGEDVLEILILPAARDCVLGHFVMVSRLNPLRYAVMDWARKGPMPLLVASIKGGSEDLPRLLAANGAACEMLDMDQQAPDGGLGWSLELAHAFAPLVYECLRKGHISNPMLDLPLGRKLLSVQVTAKVLDGGLVSFGLMDISTCIASMRWAMSQHDELMRSNADLEERALEMQALAISLESAQEVLNAEIHRRHKLEQDLRRMLEVDSLSGAATRTHFMERLNEELRRSVRYLHPVALVMMDIDRFKRINDTWGHAAGDAVISAAVECVRGAIRQEIDLVGRMGGEEFAIVMPETTLSGATEAAERIRCQLAETEVSFEGEILRFTASFGVTVWSGRQIEDGTLSQLMRKADKALYEAKFSGRNKVICTTDSIAA